MKRKVLYIIPLFVLIIIITNFKLGTSINAKENNINPKHLIAELKKEKIYLYYDKKNSQGMFKGFYIKSGKKVKYFDWENIDKPGFYPTIHLIKDKYIAVVCTEGEGSGVDIKQLYLINKDTLKVRVFENPLDVIKSNVSFDIQAPNVTIKIKNNTWNASYPNVDLDHFFDTIDYSSLIKYDIKDTYFTVTISAQVTPALFIGDIKLTYLWEEKKSTFIPSYINFNFIDNKININ